MIPQISKETPPFVRFDYHEVGRDVEASEKAGRPIPLVKPVVIVMQRGSKDEWVGVADDWLAEKRSAAAAGTYPPQWIEQFERQYAAFLKGDELPPEGTPIKTWAALTREQISRLLAFNIRTVEELAAHPDSALMNLGLDGRNMRDLAKAYIADGLGAAGSAKKIADLEEANRAMQARIVELEAALPKKKAA